MSTTFDSVYDRFLAKITDYELAALPDVDLETNLYKNLKGAISDFKYCTKDLANRDEVTKQFNETLTDLEIEILAKFMVVHWITPNVLRLENLRDRLGNKDFQTYSPAQFLEKLSNLKQFLIEEAEKDMTYYYYAT